LKYPTGAEGKRFGHNLYNATIHAMLRRVSELISTFQYLNECVYQLVIRLEIFTFIRRILVCNSFQNNYRDKTKSNLSKTVLNQFF